MHNLRQNVCRLFYGEAEHLFPKSEKKLDYYHQKMNVRVASLVAERLTLRIIGFKKLENFKKVSEMLGFGGA